MQGNLQVHFGGLFVAWDKRWVASGFSSMDQLACNGEDADAVAVLAAAVEICREACRYEAVVCSAKRRIG